MKRVIVLVGTFFMFAVVALAQTNVDVAIQIGGQETVTTGFSKMTYDVKVAFYDTALINEQLALAYRVYDQQGNALVEESERFYLKKIESNQAVAKINVNFKTLLPEEKIKNAKIVFDIVDEKNIRWFSTDDEISFVQATIFFEDSFSRRIAEVVENLFARPVLLIVQILVYITAILGVILYRKQ